MSRLLTPAETGVFAVAAVFAAFASTFRDFGVAEYLIQEKELTVEKIQSALTVNIAISWFMGFLLFFGAPFVANFYRDSGVGNVMRVQAVSFLLIPFGAVTMANFRRQLNFRPIFISGMLSSLTSFSTAIICALFGLGYMSLAWASLSGVAAMVGVSLWFRPADFPRWPGIKSIGSVIQFGKFASGIYVFGQIGRGAPEMIIGRAQDLVGVAMFSRGFGLVELFNRSVLNAIVPVCLPYFAKDNREQGSVVNGYLKSISFITVIGWPFFSFVGIAAFAAIRLFYGPQWIEAVPLAQILCLVGAVELIHYLSKEALIAAEDVKRSNLLQMGIQGSRILGLFFIIPFGLTGACFGLLAAAIFGFALAQWSLNFSIGLRLIEVIERCVPSAIITLLTVAPVAVWTTLEPVTELNYLRVLFIGGLVAVLIWVSFLKYLKHPLWFEIYGILLSLYSRIKSSNNVV